MAKIEIKLELAKPARKQGGDKYEGRYEGDEFHPYLPQRISRPDGRTPVREIKCTLEY